jgi:hypothetical protein
MCGEYVQRGKVEGENSQEHEVWIIKVKTRRDKQTRLRRVSFFTLYPVI